MQFSPEAQCLAGRACPRPAGTRYADPEAWRPGYAAASVCSDTVHSRAAASGSSA
jgi:hypothetical protein